MFSRGGSGMQVKGGLKSEHVTGLGLGILVWGWEYRSGAGNTGLGLGIPVWGWEYLAMCVWK